jgi:valyl-tRNA synthetase
MDPGLSKAVVKVFVQLYKEKLIYRDKRLVNWDTELRTAISDLEVQEVETKGSLWYIKYPIEDSDEFITVATTRPETMLGDVAVAVHPDNERLKHLIGRMAIVPLADRHVPIVGDEYADPEKGTGAVKITPAHDFNDDKVWQRHKDGAMWRYPPINILSPDGSLLLEPNLDFKRGDPTEETFRTIRDFNGLDRFVARKKIVERLEELGRIDKIVPHNYVVPHGDRSGTVIEPYRTDQWFVDAKKLAQTAIEAVRAGKTKFVPQQWQDTFFNWMENIQPWCISRQIWWGHQIPAWYGFPTPAGPQPESIDLKSSGLSTSIYTIFVAESESAAIKNAEDQYGCKVAVVGNDREAFELQQSTQGDVRGVWRDEDVLDTWFSSALWPFSTLGWPDLGTENLTAVGGFLVLGFRKLQKWLLHRLGWWCPGFLIPKRPLDRFYPTSVLVTGFDIIFFWVARMMMMGLHFIKEVPFHDVYIHALVRDASGAKMSKSKGNVIDPLQLIDEYGADALRFTLTAMAAQGRDIKLSAQRVEGYRNFATKLWNAARFAEINNCVTIEGFDPNTVKVLIGKWIITQLADTLGTVERALSDYRFNDAANVIYHFVWNLYCDWYLELTKPIFLGSDDAEKSETRATVAYVRDAILKVLHPFMPFITEELWRVTTTDRREPTLALAAWPSQQPYFVDAHEEVGWLIDLVSAVRSVRTEMNVPAGSLLRVEFVNPSDLTRKRAEVWDATFNRLARISGSIFSDKVRPGSIQIIVGGEIVALPLQGVIDLAAEASRLAKEIAKADADIARVDAKLGNPNFVARAPEEVVEEEQEKRAEAQARKSKIAEALERLKASA